MINYRQQAILSFCSGLKEDISSYQTLLSNLVIFFFVFIIQFYNSMRFGNNRQKLVLNRTRKPSELQKISIQTHPIFKMQNQELPLGKKDLNLLNRNINSSIFRKDSETKIQTHLKTNSNALRCRSLSSVDHHRKQVTRVPVINEQKPLKVQQYYPQPQDDQSTWGQQINDILWQISMDFKSRGILTLKNNRYWIDCQDFKELTKCLAQKILSQKQNLLKQSKLRAMTVSLASTIAQTQKKTNLYLQKFAIDFHQKIQKPKKLAIHSKTHQLNLFMEPVAGARQLEWKVIQDVYKQNLTPQLLVHLAEKIKMFRIQSCIQELKVNNLRLEEGEIVERIAAKTASLENYSRLIEQKQEFLEKLEKSALEMQSYLNSQPNKILQHQAQGYKQSQQQLFDLAFMLQQSSPESLDAFVQENIMIPNQSFKFQLKSFPSQQLGQGQKYMISQDEMQEFKCTIASIFASLIAKFKSLLERKHLKIKSFVGIMRQLASYTIGKREYLAQINKKMVIVSVKTQSNLEKLKACAAKNSSCSQAMTAIEELREMFELMKKTYYQAQLFY